MNAQERLLGFQHELMLLSQKYGVTITAYYQEGRQYQTGQKDPPTVGYALMLVEGWQPESVAPEETVDEA